MDGNPQYEKRRSIHFVACALNVILVLITAIILGNINDISYFTEFKPYSTEIYLVPERVVSYLIFFIGIEAMGMFGAYYDHSTLTINYICVYIFKFIIIFTLLNGWLDTFGVVFFFYYVVSFITSIRFLDSLLDELQRRQMNHEVQCIASPRALPEVLSVQSAFQPHSGQSSDHSPPVLPFVQVLSEVSVQPLPKSPLAQPLSGQSENHELLQRPLSLQLPLPFHHHQHHYHLAQPLSADPNPSQVINVMEMTATTTASSIVTSSPEKPTLSNNE